MKEFRGFVAKDVKTANQNLKGKIKMRISSKRKKIFFPVMATWYV